MSKHLALLALAAAALAACDQNRSVTNPGASFEISLAAQRVDAVADGQRAVYTLTNQVAGNAVAVFNRAADGTLTAAGTIATGGTGGGAGLGPPGAGPPRRGRWLALPLHPRPQERLPDVRRPRGAVRPQHEGIRA